MRPDFWRAETDNDRGRHMENSQGIWRDAQQDSQCVSCLAEAPAGSHAVVVRCAQSLPKVSAQWQTTYTIYGGGDVVVNEIGRAHV